MHGDVREVDGHTGRVSGVSMVESAGPEARNSRVFVFYFGTGPEVQGSGEIQRAGGVSKMEPREERAAPSVRRESSWLEGRTWSALA